MEEGSVPTHLDLTIAHDHLVLDAHVLAVEIGSEIIPLVWNYERFGNEIEELPRVSVLHVPHIQCQPVFPCQFRARWKVINLLVLTKPLVEVILALSMGPKDVPIVSVCLQQSIDLEDEANQF